MKTYFVCPTEEWWDGFDNSYELIVFDEFDERHRIRPGMFNQILDGQKCRVMQKFSGAYVKKVNMPVIVCSNYSIDEVFSKKSGLATLQAVEARFEVIQMEEGEFILPFVI